MDLDTGIVAIIRDTVRDTTVILQHKTVVLQHKAVEAGYHPAGSLGWFLGWFLVCAIIVYVVYISIKLIQWSTERYKEHKVCVEEHKGYIIRLKKKKALLEYWESDEYRKKLLEYWESDEYRITYEKNRIELKERKRRELEEREAEEDAYTDRVVRDCSLMMYNI